MNKVYLVMKNADMTEGRGPMISTNIAFTSQKDAEQFCENQRGVMGRSGEKYGRYGANDHHVIEIRVIR